MKMNDRVLLYIKYISIAFFFFLYSCDLTVPKKEDLASWTTKLEVPMLNESITFEDIIDDSLINPLDGTTLYAFTKEVVIDTVKVGEKLEIDDIQKAFSQTVSDVTVEDSQIEERIGFDAVGITPVNEIISSQIGIITLDDIPEKETDPYTFISIFPEINSFPDGPNDIPGFTLEPVENTFSFDEFSSADFTGGTLTISIENNLVIPLGATDIIFKNIDGSNISNGTVSISGPINQGETGTGDLDLNEITLPGSIIVEVIGSSPGANNVIINDEARNSSFTVNISGSALEVSSATSKIPVQTITNTDYIQLSESDSNKVESATIQFGKLIISIDNNMALSSTVQMYIPTIITPENASFQTTINIPANESDINHEVLLNNHSLVMDLNNQSVHYNYNVITLDSGDEMVTITSTDDIEISIYIEGENTGEEVIFSHFTGRVAPQNLGFEGTIDVESESSILEATLGGGLLLISVENDVNLTSVGAPTAVIIIPELRNESGDYFNITLENMSGSINQSIDLDGYSIIMDMENQHLSYAADVTTNYNEVGSYSLNDSIFIQINVTELSFDEVRGYFYQDAIVDSNTIAIDDSTKIETAQIKSGELILYIENNIGIFADINFKILEFSLNESVLDTTISLLPDGATYNIDLTDYNLVLDIQEDSQTVNYISTITLPSDEEMTLSLQDSISVNVTLTNMFFESVTGDIKPVSVEIDPVVQEIDGLPDEIEDFEFTEVEMIIDFSTNIGIPVILDLEIEASNSSGEVETSTVIGWDITADNRVVIPNAVELINLYPDTIRATGVANVSGNGTVSTSQFVSGIMTLKAPLKFNVPDNTEIEIDIEETELELDGKVLEEITIFFEAENYFDFGTEIFVYAASDSVIFETGGEDTLFSSIFLSNDVITDSLHLDSDKIGLFSGDKVYIKADVSISGNKDENGNPIPSSVLTTDSLNMTIYGRIEVLVDPSEDN